MNVEGSDHSGDAVAHPCRDPESGASERGDLLPLIAAQSPHAGQPISHRLSALSGALIVRTRKERRAQRKKSWNRPEVRSSRIFMQVRTHHTPFLYMSFRRMSLIF